LTQEVCHPPEKYATRRELEQAPGIVLKVRVDGRPDRVSYPLGFEEFILSIVF
jgi:hypothetical protein